MIVESHGLHNKVLHWSGGAAANLFSPSRSPPPGELGRYQGFSKLGAWGWLGSTFCVSHALVKMDLTR